MFWNGTFHVNAIYRTRSLYTPGWVLPSVNMAILKQKSNIHFRLRNLPVAGNYHTGRIRSCLCYAQAKPLSPLRTALFWSNWSGRLSAYRSSLCWALLTTNTAVFSAPVTQGTSGEMCEIPNPGQQPQWFWVNWAGVVPKHDYWLKCPQVILRCFLGWEMCALWSKLIFIKMLPLHAVDHRHMSGLWALTRRQMDRVV